jgi:hypothetical protein
LYGPLLEIEIWLSIIIVYFHTMEMGWIYYGFSGAIANFVEWISLFFPVFDNIAYVVQ